MNDQLPSLTAPQRPARPPRIVQFGDGVFLRGFFDWMVHTANQELDAGLGVALVQPRRGDSVARLMAQGGAYTLIQQGLKDGQPHQQQDMVDCFERGVNTHEDPEGFAELARSPEVEVIVSNTTEAGLSLHPGDVSLSLGRRAEAASYPGKLLWLLYERFRAEEANGRPLLVLPLELVEKNGQVLRQLVSDVAHSWGLPAEFYTWLEETVEFVDTLVDRIVPGYPTGQAARWEQALGYSDPHLVLSELYHSFLIRGSGRVHDVLPFAEAGVNMQVVDDLQAAREAKVSILNGTHSAITPIGLLAGISTVGEAMADPEVAGLVNELLKRCALPVLSIPTQQANAFAASVIERFQNPFIEHRLQSISLNQTSKLRSRLNPVLQRMWSRAQEDQLPADDRPLALVVAAALTMAKTEGEELSDQPEVVARYKVLWEQYGRAELTTAGLVTEALNDSVLLDLPDHPERFAREVTNAVETITKSGIREALKEVVPAFP